MSVTGKGEVSRRTSFLVLISIVTILMAALAMPALAHHDPADGPEVTPSQEDFPGGEPICPEGTAGDRINDPATDDEATVTLSGGGSATFHVISITNNELTFEVEGGLAAVVFVKGGTDGQNVYDYSGMAGGGIAHDDGLIVPTGQGISHIDFCLVAAPAETPTPSPSNPALNIRKENEEGRPLAGAVFMVEGSDEQFTTGDNGKVCITELNGQPLEDRPYLVTEITPPPGYALPAEPSQLVEPDNDGQGLCDSPDAIFVDPTATPTPSPTPTPTPSPTPSESEGGGTPTPTPTPTPSPTPRESELGGTPTPSPTPTPRESELGGNPTPSVPDTAMEEGAIGTSTAPVVALFAILALALLTYARLAVGRARR